MKNGRDSVQVPSPQGEEHFRRSYRGILGTIIRVVATLLPIYVFLYLLGVFYRRNFFIYGPQHRAIFLTIILFLVFMLVPASKNAPRQAPAWYDVIFIIASIVGNVYFIVNYTSIIMFAGAAAGPLQQFMAVCVLIPLFEATRRTSGWGLVIVGFIFLLYAKFGYIATGLFHTANYSFGRLMSYTYLSTEGIYGVALDVGATLIIGFITFGTLLTKSGAGEFFFNIAGALVGHVRGGPAKAASIASGLFGTISGSAVSDAAVTGSITIPIMKRAGYSAVFAAAVEATSATGGALMPPVMAATAFIMSEFSGLGYPAIVRAAAIPALLYYASIYFQIDFRAAKLGLRGLPRHELPRLGATFRKGWMFVVPLFVLVLLMVILRFQPGHSIVWAGLSLIAVSFLQKEKEAWLGIRKTLTAFHDATLGCLMIGPLVGLAGVIVSAVTITGLGINLSSKLIILAGGSMWILLILVAFLALILGMGIPINAIYILLSILLVPAMIQMGLSVLVAHFFVFYWALASFITPPMCPAVFVTCGIAGAPVWPTGLQAVRLSVIAFMVPFMAVIDPALFMVGAPLEIISATLTAIFGCYLLAAGFEGYLLVEAPMWQRLIFLIAGGLLIFPGWTTDAIALILLIVPAYYQITTRRSRKGLISA
ncbi:MAG: TRAP transporter fused permease subunit [Syntrophales bacterium]